MKNASLTITLLLIASFVFSSLSLSAQRGTSLQHWEIRSGLGLLPTFLKDHTRTEMLPLSLEVRYRPNERFSLGILGGNSITEARQTHHTGASRLVRNAYKIAALRGAVHSSPFEKAEIYGGILLGYSHSDVTYTAETTPKTGE
ncbi:MAG: hypothetical protein R2795_12275 [Saprospiraceae bacterium]